MRGAAIFRLHVIHGFADFYVRIVTELHLQDRSLASEKNLLRRAQDLTARGRIVIITLRP
jgi:hypothetical protein